MEAHKLKAIRNICKLYAIAEQTSQNGKSLEEIVETAVRRQSNGDIIGATASIVRACSLALGTSMSEREVEVYIEEASMRAGDLIKTDISAVANLATGWLAVAAKNGGANLEEAEVMMRGELIEGREYWRVVGEETMTLARVSALAAIVSDEDNRTHDALNLREHLSDVDAALRESLKKSDMSGTEKEASIDKAIDEHFDDLKETPAFSDKVVMSLCKAFYKARMVIAYGYTNDIASGEIYDVLHNKLMSDKTAELISRCFDEERSKKANNSIKSETTKKNPFGKISYFTKSKDEE
jgi:hypothetical protein